MKHILHPDISGSMHKIVIHLAGVGGTGSHMLANLAMIAQSMIKIERQPIYVLAFDPDVVTENNIGRQGFSPADIGRNKAEVMISRVNRFYSLQWDAEQSLYDGYATWHHSQRADIVISCVDSVKARKDVWQITADKTTKYWMDIGNDRRTAQVILGSNGSRKEKQARGTRDILPHFFDEFPDVEDDPDDDTPSCSALESLNAQDLFVNKIVASYAAHMLWQLLKDFQIDYQGMFINLETMQIRKIPVK